MKPRHVSEREARALISREYHRIQERARRYTRRYKNVDPDEIESAAMAGLIRAARNFDPCRATFSCYASGVVDDWMSKARNKCWDHCNRRDDLASIMSKSDVDEAEGDDASRKTKLRRLPVGEDHADLILDQDEYRRSVCAWLELLADPRHRKALLLRLSGQSYSAIGRQFDVNGTTVSRWLAKAQEKYVTSLYPQKEDEA